MGLCYFHFQFSFLKPFGNHWIDLKLMPFGFLTGEVCVMLLISYNFKKKM